MSELQWVNELLENEVQDLIKSVDTILFDIDGVLLLNQTVIPGSDDAVAKLRKLGKKIGFVTNNSVYPFKILLNNLKPFKAEVEEIVTPNTSILAYLKNIGFKKDIYVISSQVTKKLLKKAGYNVIEYKDIQSTELEESLSQLKQLSLRTLELCKNVGIVYADVDFNCQYGSILAAKIILNHGKDVEFISGMGDDRAPIDGKFIAIGAKYYIDCLEKLTNRKAKEMAKPGQALTEVIISKFNISDRSRVLMIGDNAVHDIGFGVNSGFRTCLVLSGVTKKAQVENWEFPEEVKPNYVASNLGEIYEKIKDM